MRKEIVKIMKMSRYSYGVVIPKDFVKKLKWREKQKLVVKLGGKSISIVDWPVSPKARRGGPVSPKARRGGKK